MAMIVLEDRVLAINSDHIVRYKKQAEPVDQCTVSTHKLVVDLGDYHPDYGDNMATIFEGTEAECVGRFRNIMKQLGDGETVISYSNSVGTTLGIREFVKEMCQIKQGNLVSAKVARDMFVHYYTVNVTAPLIIDVAEGYTHHPFGDGTDNPEGPPFDQFIKMLKGAADDLCHDLKYNTNINTMYKNGYFYTHERYSEGEVDFEQVFFHNLYIQGQPTEEVPQAILDNLSSGNY